MRTRCQNAHVQLIAGQSAAVCILKFHVLKPLREVWFTLSNFMQQHREQNCRGDKLQHFLLDMR